MDKNSHANLIIHEALVRERFFDFFGFKPELLRQFVIGKHVGFIQFVFFYPVINYSAVEVVAT